MEYQKIINLLDNIWNQTTKFKTKNWVEINYESRGTYNEGNQIRFKSSMSSLCHYSDAYILVKGTDGAIVHLNVANAITDPFKIKEKLTSKAGNDGTKKVRIIVLLKYLSNFWRPLKIPLVNCKTNLDLNWSKTCVIDNNADKYTAFSVTNTKLYVPVVTISTQDNAKLLEQLISGFKRKINWNKYQPKVSTERQNYYLDYFKISRSKIDPSFQGINRLFILSFEDETQETGYKGYYLLTVEIKIYNWWTKLF